FFSPSVPFLWLIDHPVSPLACVSAGGKLGVLDTGVRFARDPDSADDEPNLAAYRKLVVAHQSSTAPSRSSAQSQGRQSPCRTGKNRRWWPPPARQPFPAI